MRLLTIIHYEPLVGGSPIDRAVGVFDTGAFAQATARVLLVGYVGNTRLQKDDIVWISFH